MKSRVHNIPAVARLVGVLLLSLALVALAVLPQLTARLSGDEYRFRVAPLDPIEPFRGAYVALAYPDLQRSNDAGGSIGEMDDDKKGDVFITLKADGKVWAAGEYARTRPASGPYLACTEEGFQIDCGIDSWFLPQDRATALEAAVSDGTAIATVRIDGRGNAALIEVAMPRG